MDIKFAYLKWLFLTNFQDPGIESTSFRRLKLSLNSFDHGVTFLANTAKHTVCHSYILTRSHFNIYEVTPSCFYFYCLLHLENKSKYIQAQSTPHVPEDLSFTTSKFWRCFVFVLEQTAIVSI